MLSRSTMAANCGKRTLQFSSASARALLSRSPAGYSSPAASTLRGLSSPKPESHASRLFTRRFAPSRLPVELGGMITVMPLHSVTASALFTSLLSLSSHSWGCLSEGFASTL